MVWLSDCTGYHLRRLFSAEDSPFLEKYCWNTRDINIDDIHGVFVNFRFLNEKNSPCLGVHICSFRVSTATAMDILQENIPGCKS